MTPEQISRMACDCAGPEYHQTGNDACAISILLAKITQLEQEVSRSIALTEYMKLEAKLATAVQRAERAEQALQRLTGEATTSLSVEQAEAELAEALHRFQQGVFTQDHVREAINALILARLTGEGWQPIDAPHRCSVSAR